LWASKTIKHLSEDEHRKLEDWSAQLFQMLLFNLINTEQKQAIYAKYGLDWQWVRDAIKEVFTTTTGGRISRAAPIFSAS